MIRGGCLCGTVTFCVYEGVRSMSHCHCSMCRKTHGSPFATYADTASLTWTSGEDDIRHYESSPDFFRSFCGQCGSVLPRYDSKSKQYSIPAGLLDDDPGIKADRHIFVESKASWYAIEDSLPQIQGYGNEEGYRVVEQTNHRGDAGDNAVGGRCLCNAVAFRFFETPELMMYCHCSRCRKVKGAAHASNVFVKPENFEWLRGEDNVTNYDLPGAKRFGNSFCNTCGSSVPRQAKTAPVINIPAGSLDDEPGIKPKGHIYTQSKAPWFDIQDELPQFVEMPE